jgi:hypothetical protein
LSGTLLRFAQGIGSNPLFEAARRLASGAHRFDFKDTQKQAGPLPRENELFPQEGSSIDW